MTLKFNNTNTVDKPVIEVSKVETIIVTEQYALARGGEVGEEIETETLVGTIVDTCCSTIISFADTEQFIIIKNGTGKGGYLAGHMDELKRVFLKAFSSPKIKSYLKKQRIDIKQEFFLSEASNEILKMYEI
jgi:hypothetical protein